jgi:hypothetical protein
VGAVGAGAEVKEPIEEEFHRLRENLTLFTYLHLAASRPCTEALLRAGTTAVAYETVQLPGGGLPLLYPMSEVAGCLAPQEGAHALCRPKGGRGLLLGGVTGVRPANVVVLGAGVSGSNAIAVAVGLWSLWRVIFGVLLISRSASLGAGQEVQTVQKWCFACPIRPPPRRSAPPGGRGPPQRARS